jgi:hypothetical protein
MRRKRSTSAPFRAVARQTTPSSSCLLGPLLCLDLATEKIADGVADSGQPIYRRSVSGFAYREIFHDF